ncbi:MAG: lipoyl(octanoyl) transferase LipB [Deltaproteobacteria bacterium]|jgi:lipoyl(octanoyl) transferase|nr:lipoyl(octanoyl) transferase LipB [Deltaproteobacteria bacterium]
MPDPIYSDLKTMDYEACLKLQHAVHGARVEGLLPDTLLLVEHLHVLTFGRRARVENVLVSESALRQQGVTCVHIERGGDVTYHGPGQLVAYPIFSLGKSGMGILDFVERLEAVMIQVLNDYGIRGERNERNRGVWVGNKKIGFVGIAVRKKISFHGLALNVSPDLGFFQMIHPCGLKEVHITSMNDLLERAVSLAEIKTRVVFHFQEIFDMTLEQVKPNDLRASLPETRPLLESGHDD